MSLSTRTFLCSFLPLVVLILGAFCMAENALIKAVDDQVHNALELRAGMAEELGGEATTAPVRSRVRSSLVMTGLGALFAAGLLAIWSSRSIVKPVTAIVSQLKDWERTAVLNQVSYEYDDPTGIHKRLYASQITEVRELIDSLNRAATVFQDGQDSVHRAYVECVGSLASALDARDCYTAGHSHRVSEYSCAIAVKLGFDPAQQDELRIGALLHDIGKIGVPDSVLRNPGRLSSEEVRLIQQHPAIGRRILQGVHGFAPYLTTVELHHENWDGTGYPYGLRGEEAPLAARIVHVADAYDAMTSDRPYRSGMSSVDAVRILEENSGTQFDPVVVEAFSHLTRTGVVRPEKELYANLSLQQLAESVARESGPATESVELKSEKSVG